MSESMKWGFSFLRLSMIIGLGTMVVTSIVDTSKTAVPMTPGELALFCAVAIAALCWEVWARWRLLSVTASGEGWHLRRRGVTVGSFSPRELRHPNLRNRLLDLSRGGAVALLCMLISIPLYAGGGERDAYLCGGFGLVLLITKIRDTVVLRTISVGGRTLTLRRAEYDRLAKGGEAP